MRNAVILTSGLSGSSVLTSLVARAGYWTGDSTFKKPDYDTFENVELVQWNLRIMLDAEYTGNYLNEFSSDVLQRIGALANHVDGIDYRAFVADVQRASPVDMEEPATLSGDPLLAKIP